MKSLEGMAQEMFTKFSLKETGKRADWKYLSDSRKLEWMKDVFHVADYYMLELKAKLKPIPFGQKNSTVYDAGVFDGVRAERVALHQLIDQVHVDLANQLIDFEQDMNKPKRKES